MIADIQTLFLLEDMRVRGLVVVGGRTVLAKKIQLVLFEGSGSIVEGFETRGTRLDFVDTHAHEVVSRNLGRRRQLSECAHNGLEHKLRIADRVDWALGNLRKHLQEIIVRVGLGTSKKKNLVFSKRKRLMYPTSS